MSGVCLAQPLQPAPHTVCSYNNNTMFILPPTVRLRKYTSVLAHVTCAKGFRFQGLRANFRVFCWRGCYWLRAGRGALGFSLRGGRGEGARGKG